jgi:transposase
MRGETKKQEQLFSYLSLEKRVPAVHRLRRVKELCDEVLARMSGMFDGMYSETGRPSQPPERLLKSMVLMALYSVRSDRMFCEQLDYNLLFRWFLEMTLDEPSFDATTFSKNRQRLLEHEVGQEFLNEVVRYAEEKRLLSDEHFTVDGTLIEAWASLKSFKPKDKQDKDGSNFHGQTRCNDTHQSTTDPQAVTAKNRACGAHKLCRV